MKKDASYFYIPTLKQLLPYKLIILTCKKMKHKLRDNSFGVTCPCGKIVISLVIDVTIKNHFQTLVDPNRYFAEEPNDTYEIIVENK